MDTFNLALDTNASMLLQLAGVGVDRSTAFKVLDRINALVIVPVGSSVLYQPIVSVVDPLGDMDVFLVDPYPRAGDKKPALRWVGNTLCSTAIDLFSALYSESDDYDAIYGVCEYWNY